MTGRDVAAWIRDEHKIVAHLTNQVRSILDSDVGDDRDLWLDQLRQNFGRLRAHLKQHMKAEEVDGFMAPVLERRPTLSREVQHLKDEHVELLRMRDEIWEEFVAVVPLDDERDKDTRHRIQHLISALKHHEEHEELLVTFVFSQDIGTHD